MICCIDTAHSIALHLNAVIAYRECVDRLEAAAVRTTNNVQSDDNDGLQAVTDMDEAMECPLSINENKESFDGKSWSEIQETTQRINDIHKAIILRCDSVSSLEVLRRVINQAQSTMGSTKMIEIVECGVGNVTVSVR